MKLRPALRPPLRAPRRGPNAPREGVGGGPLSFDFTQGSLPAGASFTRASVATDRNISTGARTTFAIDTPRLRSDGILIEPSRSNLVLDSDRPGPSTATWTRDGVTAAAVASDLAAIRETATTAIHRLWVTTGLVVANGATATMTYEFTREGTERYRALRGNFYDASNRNIGLDLDNVVTTWVSAGLTVNFYKVGSMYVVEVTFTMAAVVGVRVAMCSATLAITDDNATNLTNVVGNTARGWNHSNHQVELGATATSAIITVTATTRAADALVLALSGSGPRDLNLTFSDDTEQVIPDVPAGNYAYPTNLNRARLKTAVWGSV